MILNEVLFAVVPAGIVVVAPDEVVFAAVPVEAVAEVLVSFDLQIDVEPGADA